MKIKKTKEEMYTQRLNIRRFCDKDVLPYFKLFANPRVHCFEDEKPESIEKARQEVLKKANRHDGSELAVCLKETDEFMGTVFGVWEGDTFNVCWNFLPEYGGMGYAYEAAEAYLEFLFNEKGARRIYAYVEDYDVRSQNLCKKLGMRREGIFKEYISFIKKSDGTPLYENTMQFAILKKEWNKRKSNP